MYLTYYFWPPKCKDETDYEILLNASLLLAKNK